MVVTVFVITCRNWDSSHVTGRFSAESLFYTKVDHSHIADRGDICRDTIGFSARQYLLVLMTYRFYDCLLWRVSLSQEAAQVERFDGQC